MGDKDKVSIVKCKSYKQSEVDEAVQKSLDLIEFDFSKYKNKKVLLKPNIVTANCKNILATVTNNSIIESVCKILKKNKCKIFIGESSFMDTDEFFRKLKLDKIAKKYNAKLIVFEQDKLSKIRDKNSKILKEFPVAKTLREMDLIINMPKMKTHSLMRMTGAIKNLFGLIPGGLKQKLHLKANNEKRFSKLMIDIYQNFTPGLTIIDGIIGMEGDGPTSGTPKKSGLILSSRNGVALDFCVANIMGFKFSELKYLKEAKKRKLPFDFEFVGVKTLPVLEFKKAHLNRGKIINLFRQRPIVCDKKKCIQCGLCASKCPATAITLSPFPVIDKKKCIRCFCCMEVCPQDALSLGK